MIKVINLFSCLSSQSFFFSTLVGSIDFQIDNKILIKFHFQPISDYVELRFVPAEEGKVDEIFEAIKECQLLHPDPEDVSDEEGDEEGQLPAFNFPINFRPSLEEDDDNADDDDHAVYDDEELLDEQRISNLLRRVNVNEMIGGESSTNGFDSQAIINQNGGQPLHEGQFEDAD